MFQIDSRFLLDDVYNRFTDWRLETEVSVVYLFSFIILVLNLQDIHYLTEDNGNTTWDQQYRISTLTTKTRNEEII